MDSIDPAFDGEDMEHCEEVLCIFLEPCGEPAHVFHFAKEPLDNIAHGIEVGIVRNRLARIAFGRNDT